MIKMKVAQVEEKMNKLEERVKQINTWIKENPQVTDPNVYEIMDCNVRLAECTSELVQCYQQASNKEEVEKELETSRPAMENCYRQLGEMDVLRDTEHHPFFQSSAANSLYMELIKVQASGSYELPTEETDRQVKRELLCKSMSVPFYIWQVQRTEPDYRYDNVTEYNQMKDMLTLYKETGTTQFVPEIEELFTTIEKNYKYSETKRPTTK